MCNDANRPGEMPQDAGGSAAPPAVMPQVIAFEYVEQLIIAAIAVVLLCTFVFRMVRVEGESMAPTLNDRDFLVSTHALYEPRRGDIVVITQPNAVAIPLIKRIIATGGDTLDIDFDTGVVYLNGSPIDEPYTAEPTRYLPEQPMEFPLTVPEGQIFAMGDNRNHSSDSRDARVGLVDDRYIMGRILFRVFPLRQIGAV